MGQFGAEMEQAMRDYEAKILERLRDYISQNNWEAFINTSLCNPQVLAKAFTVYDDVPDNLKYQFAIDAYTHTGDRLSGVRKAVRGLRKYGKPELPEEIATQDTITVYRAGEESISKAPYRLSWTTDKRVAEFFLNKYFRKHTKHLYRAKIRTADIIAYTDDREEREVLQYRKVFDIEDITPKETN